MQPADDSRISGMLKFRNGKLRREIPVLLKIETDGSEWRTIYDVASTAETLAETFVVIHHPDGTNEYRFGRAARPGEPAGEPKTIDASGLAISSTVGSSSNGT